mmetsp:Transcript_90829/g.257171  ORF Transcript_90829/g.257171 Transcript_90829/m.257171 type:complete len:259 (+) Transcript_90829:819-1595(+)
MFVTQSRIASLIASLRVFDPLSAGTTLAPSIFMRKTFNDWRSMSTLPMYTMHSRPSSAQAVAVATPCWPAPVSAMMRGLPMRFASSACPSELLILWAPVCASSSRLNQSCAPPSFSERFLAWYSGVGPPTNSARRRFSSATKLGSFFIESHATLSSSCACMSVSGMYRPPYWPKYHSLFAFASSALPAVRAFLAFVPLAASVLASGPPDSSFTRAFMASTPPGLPMLCTILEPTTTPSEYLPISSTCARVETPKPTAT